MNLKQLVEAMDTQVLTGDIIGAFDQFAADNCVTLSGPNDMTNDKSQKLEVLGWFVQSMARTNRIERLATEIKEKDGLTLSEYIFEFTDHNGRNFNWHEVISRKWEDGKVVEEKYYTNLPVENPLTAKKAVAAKAPAATKAAPAKSTPAPKVAEKVAVKAAPKAAEKVAKTAVKVEKAAPAPVAKKATPAADKKSAVKTTKTVKAK